MERHLTPLSALMLALILALTSVSMAVARGGMSLSGTMILCQDGMVMFVPLGADGDPVEHEPHCPDCTMGALALADIETAPLPLRRLVGVERPIAALLSPPTPLQGGQGRGPPARI